MIDPFCLAEVLSCGKKGFPTVLVQYISLQSSSCSEFIHELILFLNRRQSICCYSAGGRHARETDTCKEKKIHSETVLD